MLFRSATDLQPVGDPFVVTLGRHADTVQLYRETRQRGGVDVVFLDAPDAFRRKGIYGEGGYDYGDNHIRFGFFSRAALAAADRLVPGPLLIHAHDWHTAAIPAFLKYRFREHPHWAKTRSLFTIHNLAYQGRYGKQHYASTGLPEQLFHLDAFEYEGDMSLLKGALAYADRLTTVSPRYAKEIQTVEYGCGLHGMLQKRADVLTGILNGADYSV